MITITASDLVKFEHLIFSSGENHVRLENPNALRLAQTIYINFYFTHDGEIMKLLLLVDAIRRVSTAELILKIPYFPGARQDRVCYAGEALSVKVYADLINSLNFKEVQVFDPHSEVLCALLNNIKVISNLAFVEHCVNLIAKGSRQVTFVSPDAGANKKIFNLCSQLNYLDIEVVRADKKRETKTGKVVATEVFADDLQGKDCIIIDDICSRGGTFMALAQELKKKNAGNIYLIVSHYEGSADLRKLEDSGITHVYIGNNIQSSYLSSTFITQFPQM